MKKASIREIKRGRHEVKMFIDGSLFKTEIWTSKAHAISHLISKGYEINFID